MHIGSECEFLWKKRFYQLNIYALTMLKELNNIMSL